MRERTIPKSLRLSTSCARCAPMGPGWPCGAASAIKGKTRDGRRKRDGDGRMMG